MDPRDYIGDFFYEILLSLFEFSSRLLLQSAGNQFFGICFGENNCSSSDEIRDLVGQVFTALFAQLPKKKKEQKNNGGHNKRGRGRGRGRNNGSRGHNKRGRGRGRGRGPIGSNGEQPADKVTFVLGGDSVSDKKKTEKKKKKTEKKKTKSHKCGHYERKKTVEAQKARSDAGRSQCAKILLRSWNNPHKKKNPDKKKKKKNHDKKKKKKKKKKKTNKSLSKSCDGHPSNDAKKKMM